MHRNMPCPSVDKIPRVPAADMKGARMSATSVSPPAHSAPKLRSALSDRIRIARTLCIFCMTFVHVQPGIAENVYDRDAGAFDIFYFLMTRIGHSQLLKTGIGIIDTSNVHAQCK